MTHRSLAALILLNSVLLAALVVATFGTRPAQAQLGSGDTNYMMIAGNVNGLSGSDAVYIIDRRTTRLVAVTYDSRKEQEQFRPISGGRVIRNDVRGGGR